MLSILLCHSYFLRFDQKQRERAKPYPPLATLQAASMLRRAGHQVALFDAMLAEGVQDYERQLGAIGPQLVLLYEDSFNFLSKMCLGKMRTAACEMIGLARSAGARVVAAGPDVTDSPATYLEAGAEVALIGEGLATLLELIARLDSDPRVAAGPWMAGLGATASLHDGKVARTSGGRTPAVLGEVDGAAWDLVDIERYRSVWIEAHGYFSLNMAASRGCSFRCTWCAKPTWGNRYLQRPAAAVAAEMAYLKRSFDPRHIWFADDIFGFRVDWVAEFATAARREGSPVPFTIQTRADLVSEAMAHALQDAGCREAWIGAESGSQRILDAMNKGTTVRETLDARARLRNAGIRVGFFIQLGYLGEQIEDILATRSMLQEARPDDVGISVSYPLPGTKFYELVKAQLGRKTHWQDSSDLDMMFRGTYTSDFYRSVRDLLHEQADLQSRETAASAATPARRLLERRWHELVSREREFRTEPMLAAAAL